MVDEHENVRCTIYNNNTSIVKKDAYNSENDVHNSEIDVHNSENDVHNSKNKCTQ
jgi:hypothetical protein